MIAIVTGAAGFLGRHVTARLLAEGTEVLALDDESTPGASLSNLRRWHGPTALLHTHHCDLTRDDPFSGLWGRFQVAEVWHLASPASPPLYKARQRDTLRLGGAALDRLLARAERDGARLLFASSSEVYGNPPPQEHPQREGYVGAVSSVGPRSCYDEAKRYGEAMCVAWHHEAGVDVRLPRIFNCYDDQTEVLTDRGFVRFPDLNGGEKFATLTSDLRIEYHAATDYVAQPFAGEMLYFTGKCHDLMVTPNHRMLVWPAKRRWLARCGDPAPVVVSAEDIEASGSDRWRFMRGGASWTGDAIVSRILPARNGRGPSSPERRITMGDWCEFVGWFVSEGSAFVCGHNRDHRVVISQSKRVHPDNYRRIVALVRRMGFNPYLDKAGKNIAITSVQLLNALSDIPAGAANKRIPRDMLLLAAPYLQRMFDALMSGDGSADKRTYTTKSKGLADDVSELAIKLGMAASVAFDGANYKVAISTPGLSFANWPRIGSDGCGVSVRRIPYDGIVYDVTVPNHLLMVRRNGKTCWSGNTYGPGMARADGRVVTALIGAALSGEVFRLHGDGYQTRSFCYVDDTVDGLFRVMRAPDLSAVPVNVGNDAEATLWGLVAVVQEVLGVEARVEAAPPQDRDDPVRRRPDLSRLRALGWESQVGLREGIRRTAAWMRGTGS